VGVSGERGCFGVYQSVGVERGRILSVWAELGD